MTQSIPHSIVTNKCPNCRQENRPGTLSCDYCKIDFDRPTPLMRFPAGISQCPRCGYRHPIGLGVFLVYCPKCWTRYTP